VLSLLLLLLSLIASVSHVAAWTCQIYCQTEGEDAGTPTVLGSVVRAQHNSRRTAHRVRSETPEDLAPEVHALACQAALLGAAQAAQAILDACNSAARTCRIVAFTALHTSLSNLIPVASRTHKLLVSTLSSAPQTACSSAAEGTGCVPVWQAAAATLDGSTGTDTGRWLATLDVTTVGSLGEGT